MASAAKRLKPVQLNLGQLSPRETTLKVRLRWLVAVLQYTCKRVVFLSSLNMQKRIICQ